MWLDVLETNCDQCVCMLQCCFTSTETIRFISDGEKGGGGGMDVGGGGEGDYIPIATPPPPE